MSKMNPKFHQSLAGQLFVLVFLYFILDTVFVYLYPNINLLRATLVSLISLIVLLIPFIREKFSIRPTYGFLSLYLATFFGALFTESLVFVEKLWLATATQVGIIVAAYILLTLLYDKTKQHQ